MAVIITNADGTPTPGPAPKPSHTGHSHANAAPCTVPEYISAYRLSPEACEAAATPKKIAGATLRIYPQCGDPNDCFVIEIPCSKQGEDGISVNRSFETDKTSGSCPGTGTPYLTGQEMEVTIALNAAGVFDEKIMHFLTGSETLADGTVREYGLGELRPVILEIEDSVNRLRRIFPTSFLMLDSIEISQTSKSAPETSITFAVFKTDDPVTGRSYFSDLRSF